MLMSAFAPINNCGSIPNTKLVKYLAREDVEITVIATAPGLGVVTDENLISEEIKRIKVIRVPQSELYYKTVGRTREKITDSGVKLKMKSETRPLRARIVSLIKNTFFWLRSKDWLLNARRIIRKELKGKEFDILYSTYPGISALNLAKTLMRKGMAKKWIADFRDPIGYAEYNKFEYARDQRFQHRIERMADAVTIVSEGAMEKFRCKGVPDSKITYIPNGYDPDDFDVSAIDTKPTADKLRIFYAGTLYAGKRDLTTMFRAISELDKEGNIDASKVSVEYAGNEWPIMQSFAEKFGLENICTNYGFVTRTRVMEIMSEIDCSVVCSHNTAIDKGVVTGKVFELLLVGKPIIAVITGDEPNSELGAIVRDCNAGVVYEEATVDADYPKFKQWLKDTYCEKMQNGRIENALNAAERERYSYANISHQLYELLCRVSEN